MNIPSVPSPDWHVQFITNLNKAIEFHRTNKNDPYNIGNSAIVALSETRDAFVAAVSNREFPVT